MLQWLDADAQYGPPAASVITGEETAHHCHLGEGDHDEHDRLTN